MEVRRVLTEQPLFSICIPQHNRTSFLIEVCRSLDRQRFRQFDVCISDDCSTDGREAELIDFLHSSDLSFVYRQRNTNGRYDANLRSAIALASAPWCFLLGNDDALKEPDTLGRLAETLAQMPKAAVVFTNFEDAASGVRTRRVGATSVAGTGPAVAAGSFRKFSFVSGILLDRQLAQAAAVTKWDRSEMYQMYIGCRLLAAGATLLEIDLVTVRKDVQLEGERVDTYANKPRLAVRGIPAQPMPFCQVARVVIDAIDPYVTAGRSRLLLTVLMQYLLFLYPYWIVQYRRVQSWRFAAGLCRAMRPRDSLAGVQLPWTVAALARVAYGLSTVAGLAAPIWLFDRLRYPAARLAGLFARVGRTPVRAHVGAP